MASSSAATVDQYVAELPPDRAAEIAAVRALVNAHIPDGYVEAMDYGMITWSVPLSTYPETYNGHPLAHTALAAQKNYCSLYLMTVYSAAGRIPEDEFRARWNGAKRLDMGKSCVRFRRAADLDLDLIAEVVGATPPDALVAAAKAVQRKV
jgi:uncharacterized protein YdhG (YjbR/CyaY superfamily)